MAHRASVTSDDPTTGAALARRAHTNVQFTKNVGGPCQRPIYRDLKTTLTFEMRVSVTAFKLRLSATSPRDPSPHRLSTRK